LSGEIDVIDVSDDRKVTAGLITCYEVGIGAVSIVVDYSSSIQRTERNRYAA